MPDNEGLMVSKEEREHYRAKYAFDPLDDRTAIQGEYEWRYETRIPADRALSIRFEDTSLIGFVEYNEKGDVLVDRYAPRLNGL